MGLVPKKHHKASIIIVVLIIMMVSSFLVLVTMRYFMHMLSGFTSLTNYYKAYYMARGSMDMLLTQQSYRGWGYEVQNKSFARGLQCVDCGVTGSIIASFPRIDASISPTDGTCDEKTAIMISSGQSVIFPLFFDSYNGIFSFSSEPSTITSFASTISNLGLYIYPLEKGKDFFGKVYLYDSSTNTNPFGTIDKVIGFGKIQGKELIQDVYANVSIEKLHELGVGGIQYTLSSSLFQGERSKDTQFIIISNPLSSEDDPTPGNPFSICFTKGEGSKGNVPMVGLNTILRADARVADSYVTLETIKTNRFPSFLVQ